MRGRSRAMTTQTRERVALRFDLYALAQARLIAHRREITLSEVLRLALAEYLAADEQRATAGELREPFNIDIDEEPRIVYGLGEALDA